MKRVWEKGSGLPSANTLELIDQYEARVTHPTQYEYIDTSCSLPPGSGRWGVVNDCSLPRTRPLINNQNVSHRVFYHSYLQRRWVGRWNSTHQNLHTHTQGYTPLPPTAPPRANRLRSVTTNALSQSPESRLHFPIHLTLAKQTRQTKQAPGPFRGECRLKTEASTEEKGHWIMWVSINKPRSSRLNSLDDVKVMMKRCLSCPPAQPTGKRGTRAGRAQQTSIGLLNPIRLQAAARRHSKWKHSLNEWNEGMNANEGVICEWARWEKGKWGQTVDRRGCWEMRRNAHENWSLSRNHQKQKNMHY